MITENLNNFSITDADMQIILDDLAVDMDQILAGLCDTRWLQKETLLGLSVSVESFIFW